MNIRLTCAHAQLTSCEWAGISSSHKKVLLSYTR